MKKMEILNLHRIPFLKHKTVLCMFSSPIINTLVILAFQNGRPPLIFKRYYHLKNGPPVIRYAIITTVNIHGRTTFWNWNSG